MAEKNVTEKSYSVVFKDVLECYSLDNESLQCYFIVKEQNLKSDDWFVGLFPVGWESLQACLLKVSFNEAKGCGNEKYQVGFQISELLNTDVEDFYQFCFFNDNSEVVKGASSSFQFYPLKRVNSYLEENNITMEDLIGSSSNGKNQCWAEEVKEDGETLFIHNRSSMFERTLTKTLTEKAYIESKLSQVQDDYKKISEKLDFEKDQNVVMNSELCLVKEELEKALKSNSTLIKRIDDLNSSIDTLKENYSLSEDKIICEYEEKLSVMRDLKKTYEIVVKENTSLQQELNVLKIKVAKSESGEKKVYAELVKCKHDKIKFSTELDDVNKQNEALTKAVENLEKNIKTLNSSLKDANEEKEQQSEKIVSLEKVIKNLKAELKDQKDMENVLMKTTEEFDAALKNLIHDKESLAKENKELKTRLFHIKKATYVHNGEVKVCMSPKSTTRRSHVHEERNANDVSSKSHHEEILSENKDLIASLEGLKEKVSKIEEEKNILQLQNDKLQSELTRFKENLHKSSPDNYPRSKLHIARDSSISNELDVVKKPSNGGAIPKHSRKEFVQTKTSSPRKFAPEQKCPVCDMDFPFGFSNSEIKNHIESHFP